MTATKTRRAEETRAGEEARTEPPWSVILHNDWENSVTRVVWVLVRVIPGMTIKQATKIMWKAHTTGRAVAKSCHKELAELYQDGLNNEGLISTIEPD